MLCLGTKAGEACTAVAPRNVATKSEAIEITGIRTRDDPPYTRFYKLLLGAMDTASMMKRIHFHDGWWLK